MQKDWEDPQWDCIFAPLMPSVCLHTMGLWLRYCQICITTPVGGYQNCSDSCSKRNEFAESQELTWSLTNPNCPFWVDIEFNHWSVSDHWRDNKLTFDDGLIFHKSPLSCFILEFYLRNEFLHSFMLSVLSSNFGFIFISRNCRRFWLTASKCDIESKLNFRPKV